MLVACAADCRKDFTDDLERQVLAAGMEFLFEELRPFTWRKMIEWERHVGRAHTGSPVCFVDAWDFLLLGNQHELEALAAQQDVLFHSDAHCWPEPHKADLYPPSRSPYRYVNGTGPLGWGGAIADLIDYGMARFPIRGDESSIFADNDQRFWTDVYLAAQGGQEHRVAVDIHCQLSVALNAVGDRTNFNIVGKRALVYPMGTMPVFVHANGASAHRFDKELEVLRRC
jgi:hypothetical protein